MKKIGTYHGAEKVGLGIPLKGGVIGAVPQSKGVPGPMAPVNPVKGMKPAGHGMRTMKGLKKMC